MNARVDPAEVRAFLPGTFVRFLDSEDALLISDAPRRLPPEMLLSAENALRRGGWVVDGGDRSLWRLDWSPDRWRTEIERLTQEPPTPLPTQETLWEPYALARLLAAHPAPPATQPVAMLRPMLQRWEKPAALLAIVPRLLQESAERLRKHRPLPTAGAGLLFAWLRATEEGYTP